MTLQEWIPNDAHWINKKTKKHLNKKVKKVFSSVEDWDKFISALNNTTFTQQNIYSFVELEDGTLVGFNENPSHGWSFPVGKWIQN